MNSLSAGLLINFLLECRALKFGDFTLKSGIKSPFFLNLGQINTARQLDQLGTFIAEEIISSFPDTTIIFGPAYKGILLAAAAASSYYRLCKKDMGILFDRKEGKTHGEGGDFIGTIPEKHDRIVLIDDVISTGMTKQKSIDQLQKLFGVGKVDVMVLVDRRPKSAPQNDFRFTSLVDINSIVEHLYSIGDSRAQIIKDWWENN